MRRFLLHLNLHPFAPVFFMLVAFKSVIFTDRECWARICKPFKEPRNRFPAWRVGTTALFVVPVCARLHRLVESTPWIRFLGSLNVYKYGLWSIVAGMVWRLGWPSKNDVMWKRKMVSTISFNYARYTVLCIAELYSLGISKLVQYLSLRSVLVLVQYIGGSTVCTPKTALTLSSIFSTCMSLWSDLKRPLSIWFKSLQNW